MRNLKKALSLVLAMVMLLGMMVVGAGAASFKDSDQISDEYKTAAAVLEKIGVMEGTDGYFNPKTNLTRVEGAAIIYRLVTSGLVKNPVGTSGFTDVDSAANYSWASGTVAACREMGIISGVTATSFNPGEPLTAAAFSKMLLVTLGYESDKQGYTGDSWVANVSRDARLRGITLDTVGMNETLTREQAAQMAFQALVADTMEYTGMNITTPDGLTISTPATVRKYNSVNGTDGSNKTYNYVDIQPATTPIKLCEEKFPALKLTTTEDETFGRAQEVWTWKSVEIDGSKEDVAPDAVFTKNYTNNASGVASEIGKKTVADRDAKQYINGQESDFSPATATASATASGIAALTGDGRLVEVYMRKDNKSVVTKVVVIDTALGEVTKVDDKNEKITIKLPKSAATNGSDVTLPATTFGYGEFKKGDLVLVQASYNNAKTPINNINAKSTVRSVTAPTVVTGLATIKDHDNKTITVDGTAYSDAWSVLTGKGWDDFTISPKFDSTLYLDQYDYIVKAVPGEDSDEVSDNLIAVKETYNKLVNGRVTAYVSGVLSNGKTVELPVSNTSIPGNGRVCTYYKATGASVYTLEALDADVTSPSFNKATSAGAKVYFVAGEQPDFSNNSIKSTDILGNSGAKAGAYYYTDDVKFIFAKDNGTVTVMNGVQNFNATLTVGHVAACALTEVRTGYYEISAMFFEADSGSIEIGDIVYVARRLSTENVVEKKDGTMTVYYGYEAYKTDGTRIDDFFGTEDDATPRFISSYVNEDGAYDLSRVVAADKNIVWGGATWGNSTNSNALVINGKGYLARNPGVYDIGKTGISSVEEIADASNEGKTVQVSVLFDASVNGAGAVGSVKTIFVLGVGDTKQTDAPINTGNTMARNIAVLANGTYVPSGVPSDLVGNFGGGAASDVRMFVFELTDTSGSAAAATSATVKLVITNPLTGNKVYEESGTLSGGTLFGKHEFHVQVTGASVVNNTSATPDLTTALNAGVYNYSITTSTSNVAVEGGSGSFVVPNP